MDFVYWWQSDGFWYATTDSVLADGVLHGGIQVFLKPVRDVDIGGQNDG